MTTAKQKRQRPNKPAEKPADQAQVAEQPSSTEKPAAKESQPSKPPRPPGLKLRLHAFFTNDGEATLEELVAGASPLKPSAVTTALSDLKSAKYGIGGKPLAIAKGEDGKYRLEGK